MCLLGYGSLQRLERPQGTGVYGDALLYIGSNKVCSWMRQPLCQASQFLLFLDIKERQKGEISKDFPSGCLSNIHHVVCQWCYRQGVGCLCCRGVGQSLINTRTKRYAVWPGCWRWGRCWGQLGWNGRSRVWCYQAWGGRSSEGRTRD